MTIKSAFELSAYWRFDESYPATPNPATWTDDVNGLVIGGLENNSYSPGLYVKAKSLLAWSFTDSTKLAFDTSKHGFSFWFWIKKTSATNPNQVLAKIQSYTDPLTPSFVCQVQLGPNVPNFICSLSAYSDDLDPGESTSITSLPNWYPAKWNNQDWCFCCATYSMSDKKLRFYSDDTGPVVSSGTVTMYDMPTGNVTGLYTGLGLPVIDELGIAMGGVLTDAQVSDLYNGGLGMTWPDVENL